MSRSFSPPLAFEFPKIVIFFNDKKVILCLYDENKILEVSVESSCCREYQIHYQENATYIPPK